MKSYFNLACVLGILALQSCNSFSGKRPANYGHSYNETQQDSIIESRKPTIVSEYNGITIDTTHYQTTFFISRVDDEKSLAYGSFYQFDGAKCTEIAGAIPYECFEFDPESKTHMLDIAKLRHALATDSLTHIFVQRKQLLGHTYTKVDAVD